MEEQLAQPSVIRTNSRLLDGFVLPDEMAETLGCSQRSLWHFAKIGRIPQPIRLSRGPVWLRPVIQDWIREGCKPRKV